MKQALVILYHYIDILTAEEQNKLVLNLITRYIFPKLQKKDFEFVKHAPNSSVTTGRCGQYPCPTPPFFLFFLT